ncbi:MAG: zf-HC2 domain-containing protein [Nocardioidaceae bacterium]
MTCEFHHDDAAYVLGALSPVERQRFERHLADCESCSTAVRELAGLPGLLARVDPSVLEPADAEPAPPTVLPGLVSAVRREGRRRTWVALAAAAASVVVAATGASVLTRALADDGTTVVAAPAGQEMTQLGGTPIHADLAMESVAWGTRLSLSCSYPDEDGDEAYEIPSRASYSLVVRTREGAVEQVATWHSLGSRTMRLVAATQAARDDIASIEVRNAQGRAVLKLDA